MTSTLADHEGASGQTGRYEVSTPPGLRRSYWVPPLLVVAFVLLLPLRGLLRAPGPPMEEGFMLVFPERVLRGDIPNVDFLHLYGPASLWVLAGVYKIFGTSLWSERIFGYLQQVAAVLAVFTLAKAWGRWVAAAAASIAAIILLPPIGLTALAWDGGVALALWALVVALAGRHSPDERRGGRLLFAGGVLGGVALLYRPDLVLALGLSLAATVWGIDRTRRLRLVGGLALGVAPGLIQVGLAGPAHAFQGMVVDPLIHLRGGRRLPVPPSWGHFDGFLQKAGQLNHPPWPLPAPPSPSQLTIWFVLLIAAVVFLLVVGRKSLTRDHTSVAARTLWAVALMAAGLLPQALQRDDSTHLAWVSFLSLGFLAAGVAQLLAVTRPTWSLDRRALLATATPVVLLLVLVPHFTLRSYADASVQTFGLRHHDYTMRNGGRVFYYGRQDATIAVNALLKEVDRFGRPGERLFVGTGDLRKTPYSEAYLYYLLPQFRPATYYIEMDPGVANAPHSRLAKDLASADIAILSSIRDDWLEPNDSRKLGPDLPNQVLHRDFVLVHSYGKGLFGHGLYELWVRRGSPAAAAALS